MKKVKLNLKKNAPLIFSLLGVGGVVTTGCLGVVAGMKAERILSQYEDAEFIDKVKLTWRCYVSVTLSAVLSAGCIVAGHKLSAKQIAALTSLAAAGSTKFTEYRDKVREAIGEEKEEKLYTEVKERINKIEWVDDRMFMEDAERSGIEFEEPALYYDDFSDRFFRVSPTRFLLAKYHLNRFFWLNNYATINTWYAYLGVDLITMENFGIDGDAIGWSYDSIMCSGEAGMIEIFVDTPRIYRKELPEGCRVIRYDVMPEDSSLMGYVSKPKTWV